MRRLSRIGAAPRIAALVRNQCDALIGYSLAATPNLEDNGEGWLLDKVAPRTRRFIDIGANRGEWTRALLDRNPHADGIAIDASAASIASLQRLPIRAVRAAISDSIGEATFFEEPEAGEWSSLSGAHSRNAQPVTVSQTTIDAILNDAGWDNIDVLKIDTEGWDLHCLRGAQHVLAEQRVAVVQFEYNRPWIDAGSTLKAAFTLLEGFGYQLRALRPAGLQVYDHGQLGEFFRYSNFVAFTQDGANWLR